MDINGLTLLRQPHSINMIFKLATIVCFLAACQSIVLAQNDLESKSPKIIGGRDASEGEFPYQVSLQVGSNPDATVHFCGGSIINANWIMTAGHCVKYIRENSRPGTSFVVKAGKLNLRQLEASEQKSVVHKFFNYPEYDRTNDNSLDIALIKIRTSLIFNNKVSAIHLPAKGSDPKGIATLSGWGATKTGSPTPAILQTADLPIIDRPTCIKYLQAYGDRNPNIKDTTVCAGLDKSGCSGDSGSPLAQKVSGKPVIVGVTSWASFPCETKRFPTGFVRVASFIDWINNTINRN